MTTSSSILLDNSNDDDDDCYLSAPVVDLSPDKPESEIVKEIAKACSEYGFFQVTSHGIPQELLEEYRHQCHLYFALPYDVKLQWKRHESNARGFFDDELTKQRRDWKQALDFGVPGSRDWSIADNDPKNQCLDGWNQFPSEDLLPNFRSTVTRYFDECAQLADKIAILMAAGLGQSQDAGFLKDFRERHSSYLRVNYYPPCNEVASDGSGPLGISPHKDAGFLTVLLQDDECHSLQIWKDNRWITVKPIPGALTINTGDMAEVWSNGKYVANLHRVLTHETKERYSAPFFYNPPYDMTIEPLLSPKDNTPIYHPVLWGYFRAVRFAGDLTDLGVDEIQIDHFLLEGTTTTTTTTTTSSDHVRKQEIFAKEADFGIPFSVEKYRPLLSEEKQPIVDAAQ